MQAPGDTATKLTDQQIVQLSQAHFGSGPSDVPGVPAWEKAACICLAESHGHVAIVNPIPVPGCRGPGSNHATGLWQIVPSCHPDYIESRLTDPAYNAYAAAGISLKGTDWHQWSTSRGKTGGAWTGFRSRVQAAAKAAPTATGSHTPGGSSAWWSIPNPIEIGKGAVEGGKEVVELYRSATKLAGFVTDLDNWRRLLWVWAGVGLITAGVLILNRDTVQRAVVAGATGGASEAALAAGKVVA